MNSFSLFDRPFLRQSKLSLCCFRIKRTISLIIDLNCRLSAVSFFPFRYSYEKDFFFVIKNNIGLSNFDFIHLSPFLHISFFLSLSFFLELLCSSMEASRPEVRPVRADQNPLDARTNTASQRRASRKEQDRCRFIPVNRQDVILDKSRDVWFIHCHSDWKMLREDWDPNELTKWHWKETENERGRCRRQRKTRQSRMKREGKESIKEADKESERNGWKWKKDER